MPSAPAEPAELLADFERALRGLGRSEATIVDYRQRLKTFLAWLAGRSPEHVLTVDAATLRVYHDELRARKYAPASVLAYLLAVRVFYAHLTRRRHLEAPPAIELPRVRRAPPLHVLTSRQVLRILAQPNTSTELGIRDRAIVEMLYSTAMRIGELRQLSVGSLDFEGGFVRIERGKGGQGRIVPVGKVALGWARVYLDRVRFAHRHETALFVSAHGRILSRPMLHVLVRRYVEAARIPFSVNAHGFRHAAATQLLRGDGDRRRASLLEVRDLLGHRSADTTRLYTRIEIRDLERELRARHFRDRPARGKKR